MRLWYRSATVSKDARLDVGVMGPERVLEMATLHGAEALLVEPEIGSIERAKRDVLVLYDLDTPEWRPLLNPLNNLVYAATGASVRTVLIDGRIVLDEGRLTTLDEQALYARVEELARRQIARAGLPIESKWPVVGAGPISARSTRSRWSRRTTRSFTLFTRAWRRGGSCPSATAYATRRRGLPP